MTRPTILDMDVVVVPREATDEMRIPGIVARNDGELTIAIFRAMLSASPYLSAWDDVRKYVEGLEHELKDRDGTIKEYQENVVPYWKERTKAAESSIAELEKRLADAERVNNIARDIIARAQQNTPDHFSNWHEAARAYMEGK